VVIIANDVYPTKEGLYRVIYQAIDGSGNMSSPCISFVQVGMNTSSIAGNDFSSNVQVYPNPSSGNFIVSIDRTLSTEATISVVNVLGETVAVYKAGEMVNGKLGINLGDISSGVYFVHINDNEHKAVKKITISK
jgi:hypothetical protein